MSEGLGRTREEDAFKVIKGWPQVCFDRFNVSEQRAIEQAREVGSHLFRKEIPQFDVGSIVVNTRLPVQMNKMNGTNDMLAV